MGSRWASRTARALGDAKDIISVEDDKEEDFQLGDEQEFKKGRKESPASSPVREQGKGSITFVTPPPKEGQDPKDQSVEKKKSRRKKKKNLLDFFAAERPRQEEDLPVRNKPVEYKFRTFLKIYIPIVVTDRKQYGDFLSQFLKSMRDIISAIIMSTGTVMLPFKLSSYEQDEVIMRRDQLPAGVKELSPMYIPVISMKWSNYSYTDVSVLIGHEKPIDVILGTDSVKNIKFRLKSLILVDPLQCEKRACAKVLLGPLLELEQSRKDLAARIVAHPMAVRLGVKAVEILIELFRTGKVMTRDELKVRVLHVYVDAKVLPQARKLLKFLFPSKPKPRILYLNGWQFRAFHAGGMIMSDYDTAVAKNLRTKLRRFQDDTMLERYPHCKSIYRRSPVDPNVTLAKLLLSLKSTVRRGKPLFYVIEQQHDNAELVFHFHRSTHQQANQTITTLPLMIEAMFGKVVAEEWFTQDAWYELDDFKCEVVDPDDLNKGVRIIRTEVDVWEDSDSDFEVHELEEVNLDDRQIVISNFDLVRLENEAPHQIGDDTQSTWTYSSEYYEDDMDESVVESEAGSVAESEAGTEASVGKDMIEGVEVKDGTIQVETNQLKDGGNLSHGTEDTSSLTESLKDPVLQELVYSSLSADEKLAKIKAMLAGQT